MLIQGCCQPDEKIEDPCGQACPPFLKCDNGKCVCDAGKLKVGDYCVPISNYDYYAKIKGCNCITEILLTAHKQNFNSIYDYDVVLGFNSGYWENAFYSNYFHNPNGQDSIVLFDIISPLCKIGGKSYSALLAGKFVGQDSIDAWIKWYPPVAFPDSIPPIVDSCHLYLVKPKL